MAYVPVPKDFSKIKTKLALNLTIALQKNTAHS